MLNTTRLLDTKDVLFAISGIGITAVRLCIALIIGSTILFGFHDYKMMAIIGTAAIMIFDYYDGLLFNKSTIANDITWRVRRRMADSISDRLVIQSISIPVLVVDPSFLWLYVGILLREIVLSGYNMNLFRQGILIYPGKIAKLACASVGVTGISHLIFGGAASGVFGLLMIVLSFFAYREYKQKLSNFLVMYPNTNFKSHSLVEIE